MSSRSLSTRNFGRWTDGRGPTLRRHRILLALVMTWTLTAGEPLTAAPNPSLARPNPFRNKTAPVEPANWQLPLDDVEVDESTPLVETLPLPDANNTATESDAGQTNAPSCYNAPPLTLSTINISLPSGRLPADVAQECSAQYPPTGDARLHCGWTPTDFHWAATCLRYRRLRFEQVNAERYGYTVSECLQPIISGGQFFLTIPTLPYQIAANLCDDCIYSLGHYRPGSCAPRRCHGFAFSAGGALVEVGVIAGLILLIP